ncbi:MAG: hypothetical protein A2161_01485, partial [Candidatus Schekmanbacteria bacterium RBG_13_48_7]
MKAFLEFILKLDRRYIFILVFFATILPFFVPMGLDVEITPEVKQVYDFINKLDGNSKPVLLSFDYDPQIKAECHPMALAILRHLFSRNVKVVAISLHPAGPALALDALNKTGKEYDKNYGDDYCFMGYGAGFAFMMMKMVESFSDSFPQDYYGKSIKDIPLARNLENYNSFSIVITLAGNKAPEFYIIYGQSKSGVKVAAGVTAVMAADYYPFLGSGQLTGLISGLK